MILRGTGRRLLGDAARRIERGRAVPRAGGAARRIRPALYAALCLALLGSAAQADPGRPGDLGVTGEAPEGSRPAPVPDAPQEVELDRLLKLPSSMDFDQQSRNGASPDEWRALFRASHQQIADAEAQIDQARRELDELAVTGGGGQWQMAPPGSNNTEVTPLSFKLREALREGRQRLEEAERKHRELVIRADLAGVPEAWRRVE